jgi:DeoR family transcriptional regulator of aga operon
MGERSIRQSKMLERIRTNQSASISQLKSEFGVSVVTIRKDLDELEKDGLIVRKFGGAVPAQVNDPLESFNVRAQLYRQEKVQIGKLAASLIEPMDSIIVDAGSTSLEMIHHLRRGMPLTLITPALNIAIEACYLPGVTVMVPGGGILDRYTFSLEGKDVEEHFSRLHADKLFLGVRGIDLEHGLTDTDSQRIQLKQTLIKASRQVIVLADSHKIGKPSLIDIAPINRIHILVTDSGIDPEFLKELTGRGIKVLIAGKQQN